MLTLNFNKDNNNINLKANICDNDILKDYMDFDYFAGLCKDGCPHYNLSYTCPPNSPKFTDYTKDYKSSLVIAMYVDIPKDKTINDVHPYLRRVLSDLLIPLEKELNGLLTDGGRCRYCDECTYVDNLPCRFPDKVRFSMEAMGLDLDKVCKNVLDHSIMWSDDENSYCTVMGSVNFNDICEDDLEKAILMFI